jgi:DNA-binding winged helix-turn-helix (wHTH) protein
LAQWQEFRVGDFLIRPKTRELIGPSGTVRLKPRSMDVLVDLSQHAGNLRTREEVLAAVWGDIAIGEEVLTHCIWELRTAFGDNRRDPRFIETLHRSGYRLIAPVVAPSEDAAPTLRPDVGRELSLLRGRVERFWVEQVLERSLRETETLAIECEERPDLVRYPWAGVQPLGTAEPAPPATVPRGENILATFERMGSALLIAGAVGAGKTVMLLQLARLALERARLDASKPVPVVLPLASWGERALPLEQWITAEIRGRYFLPRQLAKSWLDSGRLVLLLDGLDEVGEARRADCIAAINRFRRAVPLAALVVTCREEDYPGPSLELDGAIRLLPLSSSRIAAALAPQVTPSDALVHLVTSPLLLGLARRMLAGGAALQPNSMKDRLFHQFVHDSLSSREGPGYEEKEAVRWLSRLARMMLNRNRSVLAVEELQPSWLAGTWSRMAYVLVSRLIVGLWIGVAAACFLGTLSHNPTFALNVTHDGVIGGLFVALLDAMLLGRRRPDNPPTTSGLASGAAYSALAGCAAGAGVLVDHLARGAGALFAAPVFHGLLFALVLARPLRAVRFDRDVGAVEALTWSWARAVRGWMGVGALTWCLLLIGRYSGFWPARADEGRGLLSTLPNSLLFAMVPAVLFGLVPGVVDGKTRPNHGIFLSARNAALSGGLTVLGCLISILAGLPLVGTRWLGSVHLGRGIELHPGALLFIAIAGCFGPLAALRFGGLDLVKHAVLRVLLWHQGLCPLFFPRFLEHATRRGLLRRAGGGYLFFHSTLMAYLAATEEDAT